MKSRLNKIFRSMLALVLLAAVCFTSFAFAEGAQNADQAWKDDVLQLNRIMFSRHKTGIGLGDCPVYTAPSKKALRFANNRQAVDTNKDLYEAGKTADGWLMVRYDTGTGKIRTGYIPPKKCSGFRSSFSLKAKLGRIPVTAAGNIRVTDDPLTGKNVFTTLRAGDSFDLLAKYTYHGNWWYIECTVGGKTARGFIDRQASAFAPAGAGSTSYTLDTLGTPSVSPLHTACSGNVVIRGTARSQRINVHKDAGTASGKLTVAYPARTYPVYAQKTDAKGTTWYYIFVEADSMWGWVSGQAATPV